MPKQLSLTRGYSTFVDDDDYEWLSQWRWFIHITRNRPENRYALRKIPRGDGTQGELYLARAVLERKLGRELTDTEQPDHIDRDSLNNVSANIRVATVSQNAMNRGRRRDNTSGYKGVHRHSNGRWNARIVVDGHRISLGCFGTPEEAGKAYALAAQRVYGEFACLSI